MSNAPTYHIVTTADGAFVAFPEDHFDDALDYFNEKAGPEARLDFHVTQLYLNRFYAPSGKLTLA